MKQKELTLLLCLIWALTLLYGEMFAYWLPSIFTCSWPHLKVQTKSESYQNDYVKVAVIADPQLMDKTSLHLPEKSLALELVKFYTDLNMRRSFFSSILRFKPDVILFLGDYFDGGPYLSDEEWEESLNRFKHIFGLNAQGKYKDKQVYFISGNHDIGYESLHYAKPKVIGRYEETFGIRNYKFTVGKVDFIAVDAQTLDGHPQKHLTSQAWEFVKNISVDNVIRPRVLLTHIPLYRPDGTYCGPDRSSPIINQRIKRALYDKSNDIIYQNYVFEKSSKYLLDTIKPKLILSGHDHDQCTVTHQSKSGPVKEHTLGTISWQQGNLYPSFMLLSVDNSTLPNASVPEEPLLTHLCFLPKQLHIYMWYIVLLGFTLLALLFWPTSSSSFWHQCWNLAGHFKQLIASIVSRNETKEKDEDANYEYEMMWDAEGSMHLIKKPLKASTSNSNERSLGERGNVVMRPTARKNTGQEADFSMSMDMASSTGPDPLPRLPPRTGKSRATTLELDAALGSCSVQYREIQGQESQKFLSYFKPCLIPIEGVFTSKQGNLNGEYQVSLYSCKGDYVVHVREVPFQRSSLNHEDVFILDTALKIFLFSGCNSTIQERAKGLEVVQYITENKHGGKCEVATIEDGKFVGDSDVGEFWSLFGGYAPIPREPPATQESVAPSAKQYWINLQGKICPIGSNALSKEMLQSDKCYMLDCDNEIFVWMGRQTLLTERRTSIKAAEDFVRNEGRSSKTHLTFLSEGLESTVFRSHFTNWPKTVEPRLYEEGREKVAAIFKHQGYDVKELPDEKDDEPSIDYGGTIKVWRVDGDELSLLPVTEHTRLYSGDCYIVQYTFPGNGRDETLFYAWLGCRCVAEDKTASISHINTMVDSSRTNPVMAQIHEGKEPAQFFSILKRLIVFKGGNSSGYKKFIEEKGIVDETPNENLVALFRVQGTSPDNMQAIQVDQVSSSLNSSYCYILRSEAAMYTWIGNLSSARDHNLLDRMVELFNPAQLPVSVREGNEPDIFWDVLGGKAEYPREKEIQGFIDDPHLFALKITKGDFKMKEVYNYTQDDLITEDVLLLDCQREIYIWVGLHSVVKSKQEALNLGLKFLELDVLVESLSLEVPIYVVMEGYEPPFFTRFFSWDHSKANILGNSFERKLAILKGNSRDSTPNGHKSSSNLPSGRRRSSSPLPRSAGSDYRQSGNRLSSSPTPVSKKLFEGSPANNRAEQTTTPLSDPPSTELSSSNETASFTEKDRNINRESLSIHPYERLRVVSPNPVTGIDLTKREAYLSQEEFHEKFGMPKSSFYKLPRWKQNKLKISLDLF